jgi:aminoglycoside phosphotransferase (APT) family kinase protein
MAFRARQSDGLEVVIKLTRGRNSYPVEQWVYEKYDRAGVPTPQVLYYCATLPTIGCPCLVMTMINGIPPFKTDEQYAGLFGEAGELLGKMHSVKVLEQRFGLGAFLPSAEAEQFDSWLEFVTTQHSYPESGEHLSRYGLWPFVTGDRCLLGVKIASHRFRRVVNHGDFGPDHLLVRAGKIAGVIDPGDAFIGPPEYDLAHIALYISGHQMAQLLSHYPGEPDLEMIHVYAAIIALHKASRAHQDGHAARASRFAHLARVAYQRVGQLDALSHGSELPIGLPPGRNIELDKTQR